MAIESFLKRYQHGEHEAVWAELRAHGPRLRAAGMLEEATAVARETMRRVRENAEVLVERLRKYDYAFRPAEGKSPLGTPGPEIHAQIARVEELVGTLPVSLRVFYEVVGSIDLLGGHPDLDDIDYPDPLVVEPLGPMFDSDYPDWRRRKDEGELVGPFHLPIVSDDHHHTANLRNAVGHAYSVALPNGGADAPLLYEWHHTWFVDYLRACFRWGGFPGCEGNPDPVPRMIHELAAGLQPF